MGFSGINNFGNITFKTTGQQVTWEDLKPFDADNDGNINSNELSKAKKELGLDTASFITKADGDGDKKVSEDEFALWEQKKNCQDYVNQKLEADFYGDSVLEKYLSDVKKELATFMTEFFSDPENTANVDEIFEIFQTKLDPILEDIKDTLESNDPSNIKESVLEELAKKFNETYGKDIGYAIVKDLETLAEKYIDNLSKSYIGDLKKDLTNYLTNYYSVSDSARAADAVGEYRDSTDNFGEYISNNEFKQLKKSVKTLLQGMLDSGVQVIKLGDVNIASTNAITSALAQFTDGKALMEAVDLTINALPTETKEQELVEKAKLKLEQQENQRFTTIKGSEYAVDIDAIDTSGFTKYHDQIGVPISDEMNGHYESFFRDTMRIIIEQGKLKEQMETQVKTMLKTKNISFDKIENIFNNIYNDSLEEAINGITYYAVSNGFFNRGVVTDQKVGDIVKNLVTTFNEKIAAAIDEKNASDGDIDITDLDLSTLSKTETTNIDGEVTGKKDIGFTVDGNTVDFSEAYRRSGVILIDGNYENDLRDAAEKMINGLRSQMLEKAKIACSANGIKFDMKEFNTRFNNARTAAADLAQYVGSSDVNKTVLDVRNCVNTFTTEFKAKFEAWIRQEKVAQGK